MNDTEATERWHEVDFTSPHWPSVNLHYHDADLECDETLELGQDRSEGTCPRCGRTFRVRLVIEQREDG